MFKEPTRQSRRESDRNEHRKKNERGGNYRCRHFTHRDTRRFARLEAVRHVPLDVLDHDDGVIHDHADRKNESEQADRVDGEAHDQQGGKRSYQ